MEERNSICTAKRISVRIAWTVRVFSCPPVVITIMLLVLFLHLGEQLSRPPVLCATIALMAVVPALAYPFSLLFRADGKRRAKQRKLAMALSVAGYAGSLALDVAKEASAALVIWASISNGDHKPAEYALGTVICLVSVGLAALMCGTVFL